MTGNSQIAANDLARLLLSAGTDPLDIAEAFSTSAATLLALVGHVETALDIVSAVQALRPAHG